MSFTNVEISLNRAEFRWKWLKFLERSFTLGMFLSAAALLFAVAILLGWIVSQTIATIFFVLLGVVGFIAGLVLAVSVAASAPGRRSLGAALEHVEPRLLDRLNTLLFLERAPGDEGANPFAHRIGEQAQDLLAEKRPPSPFPATRPLTRFALFLTVLVITLEMYHLYSPLSRLVEAQSARITPVKHPGKPPELALPATNNVEQKQVWGEVRITDPGTDLKVTKVDVVPLQIEASANQSLTNVTWFSTINGQAEAPHPLPPPTEPRYAAYQPLVFLDEFRLSDWDVLTYYAKAHTDRQNAYASEVFFMEVRPFREDILKMPGGEGGKAYKTLSEISSLIHQQQHIIRQTHQHLQNPPDQEKVRTQERNKLAGAESDLGDSTHHLYAQMAGQMENTPIGDALDNLAQAEKSLQGAGRQLQNNAMDRAQGSERDALSQLVAARKTFQKAVSDNPKAFEEPDQPDEPPPPVADSTKKLSEMAEFRNEAKAAQEFVNKTLEQQRTLEQQTRSAPRSSLPNLANQQQQLQKGLDAFQQEHPQAFKGAEQESKGAQQAMSKAADSLQNKSTNAADTTRQATQGLEKLSMAMRNQSAEHQLADAYKLKQMLDRQMQTFGEGAKPDSKVSSQQLQQTAKQAQETIDQLKKTAEQAPTREAFGQPLRDALSGQSKSDLDATLQQLQQAQDNAAGQQASNDSSRQQAAGQAKEGLGRVSKAFEESEPNSLQQAHKSDSLNPGGQDSFGQGMAELDSLIKQLENNRQISPEDLGKQSRQALFDLQTGMRKQSANNDRGNELMQQMASALNPGVPLELGDLKKLMDALQQFSVETSERLAKKEDKPEITHVDPSRLPPAYRGRIQKYFQKLSEER